MVNRFLRFSSNFFFNVFSFWIREGVNSEPLVMLQRCRAPVLQEGMLGTLEKGVTFGLLLFDTVQLS